MKRFRLLQARDAGDPVREDERRSFADRLGVGIEAVDALDLLRADPFEAWTDGVDAVLVGGSGAWSVRDEAPWLDAFFDGLRRLAVADVPTFASCFGFQGLVVALGGEVHRDARSEIGTHVVSLTARGRADPLFGDLPAAFTAQMGHKDSAVRLPQGVEHLARTDTCEFEAIRLVGRPLWATQFHPELTGDDNKGRMVRYEALYREAIGAERTREILDGHRPSPESNALLARFAAWV
jgi:GMP synthase (glutamine-hydrolysing)